MCRQKCTTKCYDWCVWMILFARRKKGKLLLTLSILFCQMGDFYFRLRDTNEASHQLVNNSWWKKQNIFSSKATLQEIAAINTSNLHCERLFSKLRISISSIYLHFSIFWFQLDYRCDQEIDKKLKKYVSSSG